MPPSSDAGVDKHQYPIGWYADSATTKTSGVGLWWSPLLGGSDIALATTWKQTSSDPALELELVNEGSAPPPTENASVSYLSTAIADPSESIQVNAGSTVANFDFVTDEDSLWLTFDQSVTGASTDTFHIFIDGRERSVSAPPSEGTGPDGRFLILYDLESGNHTLSLVAEGANSVSPPSASASSQLSNLRISSTTGIERNLTPSQTKGLLAWGLALIILLVVVVLAAIMIVIFLIVRKVRSR
jgi:hypothetical protein